MSISLVGRVLGALLSALFAFVLYALCRSRLTTRGAHPSRVFRVLYALFSTFLGQYYFNFQLSSHKSNPETRGEGHTQLDVEGTDCGPFKVYQVPVHEDNIAYLIEDKASGDIAVVDPADPDVVIAVRLRVCVCATSGV